MNSIFYLLFWALQVYQFILLARVLMTWIPNLDYNNPIARFLIQATEPVLAPIRNALPRTRQHRLEPPGSLPRDQHFDAAYLLKSGWARHRIRPQLPHMTKPLPLFNAVTIDWCWRMPQAAQVLSRSSATGRLAFAARMSL